VFERDDFSRSDLMAMAAVSLAVSVPMIILMKNMSDSLQVIAEKVQAMR